MMPQNISEEELDKLFDTKCYYLLAGKWAALGVCFGIVNGCFNALSGAYWSDPLVPLTVGGLFRAVAFFTSAAVFLLLWYVTSRKTSSIL